MKPSNLQPQPSTPKPSPIRIGITCGDVNGIGPEIARKAISSNNWENIEFTFIGPENLPTLGKVTAEASLVAVDAIEQAVRGCLDGELDAMVTAPICKEGLKLAGIDYPGHTEMIAALTGTKRYGMMLMGKGLRVMLVTRHLPLRDVADALTRDSRRPHRHLRTQPARGRRRCTRN